MELDLEDKVASVSGETWGTGCGVVGTVAAEGCRLAICPGGPDDLAEAERHLNGIAAGIRSRGLDDHAGASNGAKPL